MSIKLDFVEKVVLRESAFDPDSNLTKKAEPRPILLI
jgi:hypothetical protein